eukprot:Rhum_TRINITY_DN25502_c0_g1::Rhum_TRINITY_DN25502_c0_g1_i1::g.182278::m.182278/K15100/SLC25A1, CTP; solute carrier family 25 (mitochondrial citrate transporter), member 1
MSSSPAPSHSDAAPAHAPAPSTSSADAAATAAPPASTSWWPFSSPSPAPLPVASAPDAARSAAAAAAVPPATPPAAAPSSAATPATPTMPAATAAEPRQPVKKTPMNPVLLSVVAGASTGAIECFITYPTEYVKTQLQLSSGQYKGMMDCTKQTVRKHGFLGLYKGMSVLLAGSIPKQATRWGAFESAAMNLRESDGSMSTARRIACGIVAGVVEGAVAVTPAESVKTAFIMDQRGKQEFKSLPHGLRLMYRNGGVAAFYRGFLPTCMKQATNQGVRFPAQFIGLKVLAGDDKQKRASPVYNGVAGVFAGCVSVMVTQPMDLVKTRMQSGGKYHSTLNCLATVVSTEGAQVLYSGTVPRMVRVGANVGLTFTVFPLVKKVLANF